VGDALDSGKRHQRAAVGEARVPALVEVRPPGRDGAGPAASPGPTRGCIPQKHCKHMLKYRICSPGWVLPGAAAGRQMPALIQRPSPSLISLIQLSNSIDMSEQSFIMIHLCH